MRHLKRDLQRAIEHIVCYTINDISLRTNRISEYLNDKNEVIPGRNEIETTFREVLVDDYSALMQRYAVNLSPLFKYIEAELPQLKEHLAPMKTLYQQILSNGNFKKGCTCLGCRRFPIDGKNRDPLEIKRVSKGLGDGDKKLEKIEKTLEKDVNALDSIAS